MRYDRPGWGEDANDNQEVEGNEGDQHRREEDVSAAEPTNSVSVGPYETPGAFGALGEGVNDFSGGSGRFSSSSGQGGLNALTMPFVPSHSLPLASALSRPLTVPLRISAISDDERDTSSEVARPARLRRRRVSLFGVVFMALLAMLCVLALLAGLANPATHNTVARYVPGLAYSTPTPLGALTNTQVTPPPTNLPGGSATPTPQQTLPTATTQPTTQPTDPPTTQPTDPPTSQPTSSPRQRPTPTVTSTLAPTPGVTPGATSTPTSGPATPTIGPTVTPTVASTVTATGTATSQPTATVTNTAAPTATSTIPSTATATATHAPTATATRVPPTPTSTPSTGSSATVRLTAASQRYATNGAISACVSGCNIGDYPLGATQGFSDQWQSSWVGQTQLGGWIKIEVTCCRDYGSPYAGDVALNNGNGWNCGIRYVSLRLGQSTNVYCTFYVSSPSSLPAHYLDGVSQCCLVDSQGHSSIVAWWNYQPFYGNGHWLVTTADCNAAVSASEQQGRAWGNSYVRGWVNNHPGWALGAGPYISQYGAQCNPGPGAYSQYFTGSSVTSASGLAYRPVDAQNVARNRLNNNRLPSGFVWTYQSTCSPSVMRVSGNKLYIWCQETGVAAYNWSDALKYSLARALGGKTVSQAQAQCNQTYGVQGGSCTVSVAGGSLLPRNPAQIDVRVTTPSRDQTPVSGDQQLVGAWIGIADPLGNGAPEVALALQALALVGLGMAHQRRKWRNRRKKNTCAVSPCEGGAL